MKRSLLWLVLQTGCRVATRLLFRLQTFGLENVPTTGGALLVANHASFLDPVLVAVRIRRPVSFMAKESLFQHRGFGWLIRSLHAFPVRRGRGGEGDIAAIRQTVQQLQAGNLLNLYPEGTRTETGEIGPLEPGVALIARRAGVPIIPVVIDGSFEALPTGAKIIHPHRIRVRYGPPLKVEGLKADEIVSLIEQTLKQMLAELRAQKNL